MSQEADRIDFAARGIAACSPTTRIIALSADTPPENVEPHFAGCILKGRSNSDFVDVVIRIAEGDPFGSPLKPPRKPAEWGHRRHAVREDKDETARPVRRELE